MNRDEHKAMAEHLLEVGAAVVEQIADAGQDYHSNNGLNREDWVRNRRDDLGKKVMGIWAQAQVHATLATVPY